ncbi:MAG: ABC transporter substrate-binding protein [Thermoplasmata archaeon]
METQKTQKKNAKTGVGKMKNLIVVVAIIVLLGCILSYAIYVSQEHGGYGKKETITVIDDMGRTVMVQLPVQRVISTAPSNTEILFAIGAGDMVVGVDNYSDYPAEARNITHIGDFVSLNIELIVSLKPDVVFAYYGQKEGIMRLEQMGIPTITIRPQNLDDILREIMLISTVCGKRGAGENLTFELRERIANITEKTKTLNESARPRVYYELWNSPFMSAGPGSFINDLIRLAGGKNIAGNSSTDYPVLTEEYIISANPEVIITSSMNMDTPEKILNRTNWQNMDAIKNHRVYAVDDNIVSRPGPRIVEGLEALAKIIHPEIFGA